MKFFTRGKRIRGYVEIKVENPLLFYFTKKPADSPDNALIKYVPKK
ncbi:hypothetical protein bthur0013_58450 [Bacillus thuringiensis IBL 200]|nr:hypothetical protein bthur0013_58450 [Bacillus thuringiensis IBL 200]